MSTKLKSIRGDQVFQALEGKITNARGLDQEFTSISADSRTCEVGCLFVSLETVFGKSQEHTIQAISRGACGIVSLHKLKVNGASFFEVQDAAQALYLLAALWRRQFSIPIVAVAGNVGKTTTKDLLACILKESGSRVLKTSASQNGDQGIPSTLIQLRENHDVAVVEIGIDGPGAMLKHAAAVQPNAVIITSLGVEHLDRLIDAEGAAREEFELVLWAQTHGAAIILNGDNDFCLRLAAKYLRKGTHWFYSMNERYTDSSTCSMRYLGEFKKPSLQVTDRNTGERFSVFSTLSGDHNASNLLGAIAVAAAIGAKPPMHLRVDASSAISSGRSELRSGPKGTLFLCDYYNSSPASVDAAFKTVADLRETRAGGQVWLCLGDMLDLGAMAEAYHRQLAERIPEGAALLSVGSRMRWTQLELEKVRPEVRRYHFNNKADLALVLYELIAPRDLILIKGSRAMAMEEIWKSIVEMK
jgi:UDP-N-acetylmuramoyl-tripeptide--D-alanyl-D-alanine ligase